MMTMGLSKSSTSGLSTYTACWTVKSSSLLTSIDPLCFPPVITVGQISFKSASIFSALPSISSLLVAPSSTIRCGSFTILIWFIPSLFKPIMFPPLLREIP
ncbi:hypothetical protein I3842_05G154700 [Carya illinoinensis]|uniref:Uncharacterized protein n=1 Tax=Carya illinoinensis TaxID=32201 RepID=A0A922F3G9_CARIL|nr:hypothetical protein I3842_05G154700 [Carya illinoinensis]